MTLFPYASFPLPANVIPRGLKWLNNVKNDTDSSPSDYLLSTSDDHIVRIFKATQGYQTKGDIGGGQRISLDIINEYDAGDLILDFCWNTSVNESVGSDSDGPSYFISAKGRPVQLRGAPNNVNISDDDSDEISTNTISPLLATFTGLNQTSQEPVSAFSVCTSNSPSTNKLFCGYSDSTVQVFDITRGSSTTGNSTSTCTVSNPSPLTILKTNTRKKNFGRDRPTGIIGCLDYQNQADLLAVGSYSGKIGIYDGRMRSNCTGKKEGLSVGQNLKYKLDFKHALEDNDCYYENTIDNHKDSTNVFGPQLRPQKTWKMGAPTQLSWLDEHHLVSGHRRDPFLRVWDIRKCSNSADESSNEKLVTSHSNTTTSTISKPSINPLTHRLPRSSLSTHQRLSFSIAGPCILSGDDKGKVNWYRLDTGEQWGQQHVVGELEGFRFEAEEGDLDGDLYKDIDKEDSESLSSLPLGASCSTGLFDHNNINQNNVHDNDLSQSSPINLNNLSLSTHTISDINNNLKPHDSPFNESLGKLSLSGSESDSNNNDSDSESNNEFPPPDRRDKIQDLDVDTSREYSESIDFGTSVGGMSSIVSMPGVNVTNLSLNKNNNSFQNVTNTVVSQNQSEADSISSFDVSESDVEGCDVKQDENIDSCTTNSKPSTSTTDVSEKVESQSESLVPSSDNKESKESEIQSNPGPDSIVIQSVSDNQIEMLPVEGNHNSAASNSVSNTKSELQIDVVVAAAWSMKLPLVATCSGSRHYKRKNPKIKSNSDLDQFISPRDSKKVQKALKRMASKKKDGSNPDQRPNNGNNKRRILCAEDIIASISMSMIKSDDDGESDESSEMSDSEVSDSDLESDEGHTCGATNEIRIWKLSTFLPNVNGNTASLSSGDSDKKNTNQNLNDINQPNSKPLQSLS